MENDKLDVSAECIHNCENGAVSEYMRVVGDYGLFRNGEGGLGVERRLSENGTSAVVEG